jgi:hypothetical protein
MISAAACTGHRRHTVSFLASVSYAELTGRVLMAVRNHGENGMYKNKKKKKKKKKKKFNHAFLREKVWG